MRVSRDNNLLFCRSYFQSLSLNLLCSELVIDVTGKGFLGLLAARFSEMDSVYILIGI